MWGLALTKLDVLSGSETIKICTSYQIDGANVSDMPGDHEELGRLTPVYESLPGWSERLSGARCISDLPFNAQRYIRRVEELSGVPIVCVSVGADRGETILLKNPFD